MRRNLFGLIAAISLGAAVSAAQKPEDAGTTPARGDTIVVRGCVSGSLLKDLRQQKTEVLSGAETAVVYRLAGDKKLLQQIQKEHQNQVLDVTGILPPEGSSSSTTRSKEFGKTRVFVGAGQQASSEPPKPPTYPTLRVTSFQFVRPGCQP